jgi:hypothetical protein
MNLDLNIKKINDNTYRICDKNNKLFTILIPSINAPFGIENNSVNLEINMSKSHHSQLLGDLYKLDNYLKSYIENIDSNIIWKSSLKKRENWHNMLKTQLSKKGLECYKEDCSEINRPKQSASHISIYDINLKNDCSIELVLQSLWVRNNYGGIIWEIKKIKELAN